MKELVINKLDLIQNINTIKKEINSEPYTFIGVVKGNGYGLGLIEYSKVLIENNINMLAIATTEEAVMLRKAGIDAQILNLSSTSNEEELKLLIENNITITIGSCEAAEKVNKIAQNGHKIKAHIKIDTGFGRYGFLYNDLENILNTIKNLDKNIEIEGIFSHFSLAYYEKNEWTKTQFERFKTVLEYLKTNGIEIKMQHICNSPAFINYPEMRLNAARIGSAFLGRIDTSRKIELKKIGELRANISEIKNVPENFNIGYLNTFKTTKETKIAIVPVGSKDGFNVGIKQDMFRTVDKLRELFGSFKNLFKKQNLKVRINGKQYNIIGRVGMYHVAVDITGSDVNINDSVLFNVNPIYVDERITRRFE